MSIEDIFKEEFKEYTDDLSDRMQDHVNASLERITAYMQQAITTNDWERAKKNIEFEKSTIASYASISMGQADIRLRKSIEKSMEWVLAQALKAL